MTDKPVFYLPGQTKPYKEVVERLKAAKTEKDYDDVLRFAYDGAWSAANETQFVAVSYKSIPDALLYRAWIAAVCDDRGLYNSLFKPEIIARVMAVKAPYVDENQNLVNMLDADGSLTIYHGYAKKTLHDSNSWTVNRDIAEWFGRRNCTYHNRKGEKSDTYWVASGKAKLADVIAFITERNEDEIVVLGRNVKKVVKEEYRFDPEQDGIIPSPMFPWKSDRSEELL
jgi:hypothetical protein